MTGSNGHMTWALTEFLLSSSVPAVEDDFAILRVELERPNFYTHSRNILFFEFTSLVARDEGSFSNTTVADKDKLELGDVLILLRKKCTHKAHKNTSEQFQM